MSRLIFEGDTISRFGKKIPTPFIEKIKIFEDKIEAELAIYLHITDDATTNQQIYEDLNNFVLFTPGERNGISVMDSFEIVRDTIYNSKSQRFAKLFYKESKNFDFERLGNRELYYYCYISISSDESGNSNTNLNEVTRNTLVSAIGANTYDERKNYSSPLVYEKVLNFGGEIANEPILIYENSLGLPYESIPLQSIQKDYYKTTDSFREDLKKQIDDLVVSYGTTEDQQLQSFLDSISYIAQTESNGVIFLTELDRVRNSFPSRTSTSQLGVLYNRLKTIIFSANDALILGESLQKKIVPNTKLVDLRGTFLGPTPEWRRREEDSYEPRVDGTGDILYRTVFMERQQIEAPKIATLSTGEERLYDAGSGITVPDFDVTSIFGYFFFDYEKSLHKKSNISQVYEVQKLLDIFGNGVLDPYFQIEKTELRKFRYNDEERRITTPYKDNLPLTQLLTPSSEITPVRKVVYSGEGGENSSTEIPYVVPRAFDTVSGLEGYRLIAFEFQDFEISNVSTLPGQSYRFNVFIDDNTLDFYKMLVEQFEENINLLKEYLSFAEEFCSYNNIDDRFNDFFTKAVTEFYVQKGSKPWQLVPKLYAIHADLIRDKFSGVRSSIAKFAEEQAILISPENGTLEQLRNFTETVEGFYNKYYSYDTGEITVQISARISPDGNLQPSLRDNVRFIATIGWDDLPDVIDFTVDPQPPSKIKLWNGEEKFADKQDIETFIDTRAATLAAARGEGKSFEQFKTDNEGFETLEGLIPRLDTAQSVKIRKFINLIMKFLSRLPTSGDSYTARKSDINSEIDSMLSRSGPQIYKDLSDNDIDFIRSNKAVFGNIGLMYIKAEKENIISDTNKWFRRKTKNIRN